MFSHRIFRVLFVLVIAIFTGVVSGRIAARSADMFFLDWRQILANGKAPSVPIKVIDISGTAAKSKDKEKVDTSKLVEVLENISKHSPRFIFLTISKNEIDIQKNSLDWRRLVNIEKLYLLTDRVAAAAAEGLDVHPALKDFPRIVYFETTWDTKIDTVSRRIITYFDLIRSPNRLSGTFKQMNDFFGFNLPPEHFSRGFEYVGTEQIYLKIWPKEDFGGITLNPQTLDSEDLKKVEGQVVLVDSYDLYSMNAGRAITYRTSFKTGEDFKDNHWSNARIVATFMTNLYSGEYVKQPTSVENAIWISVWVAILIFSAVFFEPKIAFVMGFVWILVFVAVSVGMFRIISFNFDMTRILVVSFLLQYLVIPIRLIRHLRQQDRREVERMAELRSEKSKARLLVKAASSDMQMRVVAQVSHDIRSPLMALQIAYRVIKDGISQEASELIKGSIDRLKFIAEDTLSKFKNEHNQESEIDLREAIIDVADTFKVLYPDLQIKIDIPFDVQLLWPTHSLARAFTNLFNNSIEAFGSANGLVISVSTEAKEDHHIIRVQDNGPGIPENIIPKLFKAGATFGKETGTGLGLYQVRKDLEDFGGRIHAEKSTSGALFEIILPRYLEQISVVVTRKVIAITEVEFSLHASPSIVIQKYRDLATAKVALQQVENLSEITLFTDLVFTNDEETAFDLIESFGEQKPFKTFICTSLGENEEIRKLSDKYGVLLVTRSLISRFVLSIEK